MTKEAFVQSNEHNRLQKFVAVAAIALGLSACQNADGTPSYEAAPNMQGFLKPGDTTHCFNGGERPCALLLRAEPKLSAPVINAAKTQTRVEWPLEAYADKSGDTLTVLCYDAHGQKITSYENDLSSSDWYRVVVPAEHLVNKDAHPDSMEYGGAKVYLGWASVTWFNQSAHDRAVPKC